MPLDERQVGEGLGQSHCVHGVAMTRRHALTGQGKAVTGPGGLLRMRYTVLCPAAWSLSPSLHRSPPAVPPIKYSLRNTLSAPLSLSLSLTLASVTPPHPRRHASYSGWHPLYCLYCR